MLQTEPYDPGWLAICCSINKKAVTGHVKAFVYEATPTVHWSLADWLNLSVCPYRQTYCKATNELNKQIDSMAVLGEQLGLDVEHLNLPSKRQYQLNPEAHADADKGKIQEVATITTEALLLHA